MVEGLEHEAMITKCEFCNFEVGIREIGVHQYTRGWVKSRAGGGGHGVSLPERENRWAHGTCVERRVKGYDRMDSMFPDDRVPTDMNTPPPIEDNGTNAGFEDDVCSSMSATYAAVERPTGSASACATA